MATTYLPTTDSVRTVDVAGKVLGRVATEIAIILRGKDKPTYAPHKITGDRVIVTNAAKIRVTGRKLEQKTYARHTSYLGHLKTETLAQVMAKDPAEVVRRAVQGMLPSNRLRKELMKRLDVYAVDAPKEKNQ